MDSALLTGTRIRRRADGAGSAPGGWDAGAPSLRTRYLAAAPWLLSRIAGLVGLLAIAQACWPHRLRLLSNLGPGLPGPARALATLVVVAAGLVLLRVAVGLRKRKRNAWRVAVLACAAITAGDLVREDRRLAGGVAAAVLLAGLLLARRTFPAAAARPVAVLPMADESRLRELLRRHGATDSLGYFALRRDKSVVWSASGKAAIMYRVVLGVALASGDPIGDIEAWPGAIAAFRERVSRCGWTPAVLGCSERGAVVYRREYGLHALALGDEAILQVATFTLDGRAMRCTRQAGTRLQRAGYEVRVRRAREVAPGELDELRDAAAAWRTDPVERGYSMALSRLGDPADPDCVIATAYQHGVLRGLLHFVPWGPRGLSLDLMRRDRGGDNGLNEFMIASVMQQCPAIGVDEVSLNFAVFRDALERGAQIGAGPVLRLWRRVLLVASRWWQIDSLYRFNAKFQPQWQARFVSYPAARDVPRIALAALEAEAFIVRPSLVRRRDGRA